MFLLVPRIPIPSSSREFRIIFFLSVESNYLSIFYAWVHAAADLFYYYFFLLVYANSI